jgi:hypothetical protein
VKKLVERMPSIKSIDQMWPTLFLFFPKFGKFCEKERKRNIAEKYSPFYFHIFAKFLAQKK